MRILIKGYLDVFDPEAYKTLARNSGSWYWARTGTIMGPFMRYENRKLVMDAIFGDNPIFKIKTYAKYLLNLDHSEVGSGDHHRNEGENVSDRYPNPHLYYASCLGSYRSHINRALQRGDLVGAISQCITSAHSVNVTESATFGCLCRDLFTSTNSILEGPDGESYTVLQAYEYLTKQNTQTNEVNNASI
jgi:hypothetical protein